MVDVVTHAGIGLILAAPFLATAPETGLALAMGSVLPDLDVISRLLGKRAFLAAHQTWSHALPIILGCCLIAGITASGYGLPGIPIGVGLATGMAIHSLLDLTNTYGITLWMPWKRRRMCAEWMFFIDAGTIILVVGTLIWLAARVMSGAEPGWEPALTWLLATAAWLLWRAFLRLRAASLAPPGTVCLIPSAWHPLRFYGTSQDSHEATTFTLDVRTGAVATTAVHAIRDGDVDHIMRQVPEVAAMQELSPAYHALSIKEDGDRTFIHCQDLRIRNFTDRFGACDISVVGARIARVVFHV